MGPHPAAGVRDGFPSGLWIGMHTRPAMMPFSQ